MSKLKKYLGTIDIDFKEIWNTELLFFTYQELSMDVKLFEKIDNKDFSEILQILARILVGLTQPCILFLLQRSFLHKPNFWQYTYIVFLSDKIICIFNLTRFVTPKYLHVNSVLGISQKKFYLEIALLTVFKCNYFGSERSIHFSWNEKVQSVKFFS